MRSAGKRDAVTSGTETTLPSAVRCPLFRYSTSFGRPLGRLRLATALPSGVAACQETA